MPQLMSKYGLQRGIDGSKARLRYDAGSFIAMPSQQQNLQDNYWRTLLRIEGGETQSRRTCHEAGTDGT